jgi:hypothetical protein
MHMSENKKKAITAFKSMGAAGLAAATLVSGLSFGPAAVAASSTTEAPHASTLAVAAPTITDAYRYTRVDGTTEWQYMITGTASASLYYNGAYAGQLDGNGKITFKTTSGRTTGNVTFAIYKNGQTSPLVNYAVSNIKVQPPAPTVAKAISWRDNAGRTNYQYTVTGVPGFSLYYEGTYVDALDASGTRTFTTTTGKSSGTVAFGIYRNPQTSPINNFPVSSIRNEIPAPVVTNAHRYTDTTGATKYAYTVTGAPNTKVQYGAAYADWTNLGELGASGTATFVGKDGSTNYDWDFRLTSNGVNSPKTVVAPTDVTSCAVVRPSSTPRVGS